MKTIFLSEITTDELRDMISQSITVALKNQNGQKKQTEEKLLSRREAAELLDVSLPTLGEYTKTGKVKGYRLGGKIKYKQSELLDAMNAIEPLKYRRG